MDNTSPKMPEEPDEKRPASDKKDEHFFDRWKNPGKNKMGNDITGDMKVANSNGDLEGGQDKRWHMENDEQE